MTNDTMYATIPGIYDMIMSRVNKELKEEKEFREEVLNAAKIIAPLCWKHKKIAVAGSYHKGLQRGKEIATVPVYGERIVVFQKYNNEDEFEINFDLFDVN